METEILKKTAFQGWHMPKSLKMKDLTVFL